MQYKTIGASLLIGIIALWQDEQPIFYLLAFYTFTASFIFAGLGHLSRGDKPLFAMELLRAFIIFVLFTFFYF
jgi:hypothetical protein